MRRRKVQVYIPSRALPCVLRTWEQLPTMWTGSCIGSPARLRLQARATSRCLAKIPSGPSSGVPRPSERPCRDHRRGAAPKSLPAPPEPPASSPLPVPCREPPTLAQNRLNSFDH
jgi:hypothetical protein